MPVSPVRYNWTAIALHWVIAALILFQLYLGLTLDDLPKAKFFAVITLHKSIGATILILAALRLLWRLFKGAPAASSMIPAWQKTVSHVTHWLLYVLFFAVPLSGWTMSSAEGRPTKVFGLFALPDLVAKSKPLGDQLGEVHEFAAYALAGLVTVHIGAALFHYFIKRDDVLSRMLPLAKGRGP
jgi:cytochrome b561